MQKVLFPRASLGCPLRAIISNHRQLPSLPPSMTMIPFELLVNKAEINLALTRCRQHPAGWASPGKCGAFWVVGWGIRVTCDWAPWHPGRRSHEPSALIFSGWRPMHLHLLWSCLQLSSLVAMKNCLMKNLPANAGDTGLISGPGRSPGEGNGNPLQYSFLENSMDRGAWLATVHGVVKSQTTIDPSIHPPTPSIYLSVSQIEKCIKETKGN